MTDTLTLPDGTVFDIPEFGEQMPRFWTCPPRHIEPEDGCKSCLSDVYDTGCGEYLAEDVLPWAAAYGYVLDPWQEWYIRNMLGVKPNMKWAAKSCCIICSRQNGKGTILEVRELGGLYVLGEEKIIHTAHLFPTAIEHFNRLATTIEGYPDLSRRLKGNINRSHGQESIRLRPEPTIIHGPRGTQIRRKVGPVLQLLARSKSAGRGFTGDCLVYDEDMFLTAEQIGASNPALSAKPNSQIIYAGSAGMPESEHEGKLRQRIVRDDKKMFGAEYSINPHNDACPRDEFRGRRTNYYIVCKQHDDRDDPKSWAKANPGFGYRITAEWILEQELPEMPEEEFDRERCGVGQWPEEEAKWAVIKEELWRKLGNPDPGKPQQPIAFAADIDEDGRSATISAAWSHHQSQKFVVEIPRDCTRQGSKWVLAELDRMYKRWHPVGVGLPRSGPAASLIEDGKKLWRDRLVVVGTADEAAAFAWFLQQAKQDKLWHFGQAGAPTLWNAVARAETRVVGDGGKAWSRRDSESDITPITSATLAAFVLNKMKRGYDPMKTIAGASA